MLFSHHLQKSQIFFIILFHKSIAQLILGITFGISNQNIMNYTLKKTETNRKTGKFFYEVIDESGNVISTRSSNREYVACTINGNFYFGRIDLIGKGEHGKYREIYPNLNLIAYLK